MPTDHGIALENSKKDLFVCRTWQFSLSRWEHLTRQARMDLPSILSVFHPACSLHRFAASLLHALLFYAGLSMQISQDEGWLVSPSTISTFLNTFASLFSPCLLTLCLITVSALRRSMAKFRPLRDFKLQPPAFHFSYFRHLSRRVSLWRSASAKEEQLGSTCKLDQHSFQKI